MAFSTSKFDALVNRPPTPPRDIDRDINDALDFLSDSYDPDAPLPALETHKSSLETPEQSPSSETGTESSSRKNKPRVSFDLQACTISSRHASPQQWTPSRSSPLRPTPKRRTSQPLKSILKPYDPVSTPPTPAGGAAAHRFQSFAEMLESMVKMLAKGSRSSKLDAYITLGKTLQAYEKVPDPQALVNQLGLLTQFVRRDLTAPSITGTGLDSQLITQALKFLMVLVRVEEVKPALEDDFCNYIIDRIVQVATDASQPKSIVNTYLALLMQQNFRSKTMTMSRVEAILDALDDIEKRITGFSVQAYRIRVYRKLIQQKPEVMARHAERWLKHTLKSMLSNQKDINQSAFDTAQTAAKLIGNDRQVKKAALTLLNRVNSEGTFTQFICREMESVLASDNDDLKCQVPLMWGTVTAFLRDSDHLGQMSSLSDWLKLFNKFFTCDKKEVKVNANIAFTLIVYAVDVLHSTPTTWSKFLVDVPRLQLQQRGSISKEQLESATSGYLTLLYYALRPTESTEPLDRYWKEYVVDFWGPLIRSAPSKNSFAACRVVRALFAGSKKGWYEQRALELKKETMIQREELPMLDPRWVRRNLSSLLPFVETLVDKTPWTPSVSEDAPVKAIWVALLDSLAEARSKEVLASKETKDAVAHTVNVLRRVWDAHTSKLAMSQQRENNWADKFCFLVDTAIRKLGAFQFADKCLALNENEEFEAATPSHRSRHQAQRTSPLLYFIDLLTNRSEGKLSDPVRLRIMQIILEPCLKGRNTRLAQLELLRDCAVTVASSSRSTLISTVWGQLATSTTCCIQALPSDTTERASQQLGKEYDIVVDILSLGCPYILEQTYSRQLLTTFIGTVRREAGDGAVVLAAIEKVSEAVLEKLKAGELVLALPHSAILLNSLPAKVDRRSINDARQRLWPSSAAPARPQEFDPYAHLYKAVVPIGLSAYQNAALEQFESVKEFLNALASSVRQCPVSLLVTFLRKIQGCATSWIADSDKKLHSADSAAKQVYREVLALWQSVGAALERIPRKDSMTLLALTPIIISGFSSRRRGIVNVAVETWNKTFGQEESLRYPSELERALQLLQGTVELSLPGFPAHDTEENSQPSFYESETDEDAPVSTPQPPQVKETPHSSRKSKRKSRTPVVSTGTSSRRSSSRLTPKVRLRHDNSQIQFEPIISSPTNAYQQESQVLTERQREMIERHQVNANMFPDIRSTSELSVSRSAREPSPVDPASDAATNEDLSGETSRTPLRTRASLGPMDVFLGSSPTPQARPRSQVLYDATSVTTPNAIRTVRLENEEELNSSPPQIEKMPVPEHLDANSWERGERSASPTIDEDETVDDTLMPELPTPVRDNVMAMAEDELPHTEELSDPPSSTVDIQLTAQIAAEIIAQTESSASSQPAEAQETSKIPDSIYVDAPSEQLPSDVADDQIPARRRRSSRKHLAEKDPNESDNADTRLTQGDLSDGHSGVESSSGASGIEKSFLSAAKDDQRVSSPSKNRRSLRVSSQNADSPSSAKKRKQSPVDVTRKTKKRQKQLDAVDNANAQESPRESESDGLLDCIVVDIPQRASDVDNKDISKDSPAKGDAKRGRPKRKSMEPSSLEVVPETTIRKPSTRRSTSLLSHVETNETTEIIEDTPAPAPKRARKSISQDVSDAKTPSGRESKSQGKRLSHVQITPKMGDRSSSVLSSGEPFKDNDITVHVPATADEPTFADVEEQAEAQPDNSTPAEVEPSQPPSQSQTSVVETSNRSFAERIILTPRGILGRLKGVLQDFSQMVGLSRQEDEGEDRGRGLTRQEEREFDDVLFDLRRQVHAAGRREDRMD